MEKEEGETREDCETPRDQDRKSLHDIPLIQKKPTYLPPKLSITLDPAHLAFHVAILCFFIGSFTIFALSGFELPEIVYDTVGTSTNADARADFYNFQSGLYLAFVEVAVGWWIDKIQPTFIVFLHNLIWSSKDSSKPSKRVDRTRSAVIFIVPIIVVLTLGNSIRGFQASPTTVGYNSTMNLDDFKKSQSNLERLQNEAARLRAGERRPADTILKNAVFQKSTPFSFVTNGVCTQQNSSTEESVAPMNVDDLAFTGVVYGFYPNEWTTEINFMNTPSAANYSFTYAEAHENLTWPEEFDLYSMLNLFFHGSVMVDRAIANSEQRQHFCTETDGRSDLDVFPNSPFTDEWTFDDEGKRICQGPASSLFTLLDAANNVRYESINDLSDVIVKTLNVSFPSAFDLDATTISMEKRNLTEQIQVEALTIDVILNASTVYGQTVCEVYNVNCEDPSSTKQPVPDSNDTVDLSTLYFWDTFSTSFCGNTSCVFFDTSNTFHLQKEVAAIPLVNCTDVLYDGNYGGWYPTDCSKSEDQVVLYGIGSYISGDSFVSTGLDGDYNINGEQVQMEFGPYIENPRRHVQFSFVLLAWNATPLQEVFDAQCDVNDEYEDECTGIWYQLPQTKRYLFAGKDMIPVDLIEGDFYSPTPLVQLNTPSPIMYDAPIELEYLNFDNFKNTKWDASLNQALANDSCSSLMESYLHQLKDNNYFLDRPLEVIYTSAFFYLMQNAGVADLKASSLLAYSSDRLANVQLKGDRQLRRIALSIPTTSFWISLSGCLLLVLLAIIVLVSPVQNSEYFKSGTSTAAKYVAMKTNAKYPDLIYQKTLKPIGNPDADSLTMDTFQVESMILLHQSGDDKQYIELSGEPV
ncbi:hypothetical protein P3T76_005539 [Phytophthora citrophthora]|uniref:Transmembrane protein n=1 Tax=Phytophthora citrophthora TaxID=4793 RepID=A0AAD9GQF0_9STRA|nr:hypothetical protein P3T76_005539 [Phytophthora citrophthora]